jgi:hypothetical protein
LNALKFPINGTGKGFGQEGFSHTGHIFEENMTPTEKGNNH